MILRRVPKSGLAGPADQSVGLIGKQRDELDPAYRSDQRDLMPGFRPDNWFYGHIHHKAEAQEGETIIRNISLGYPEEVPVGQEAGVLLRGMVDTRAAR
ncbi:hypothetical protein [Frigidibacter mobilis]|uniref:Metallophosphoesterase n=1 Tax=Frigidibacter mobilis TaxID=1335048 RepID=A0A159Z0D7_9RHOB|nr:hypothetical protein [Frigidibacter mobilis]AMY68315.1 metallophosphoesterase [Frigidibacter mobilis]